MVGAAFTVFQARYDGIMHGQYEAALLADSEAAELSECLLKLGRTFPELTAVRGPLIGRCRFR